VNSVWDYDRDEFIEDHLLQFDSVAMDSTYIDPKLEKQGWKLKQINKQFFRYRTTCRKCLNEIAFAREVWGDIDRERRAKDSNAKKPDDFYSTLVGAEGDGGSEDNFWKNFSE
jgi:hypothetical protein